MHACIAALSQNVPAVAIAYSDKFIGVMQTVGVGGLVADPRTRGEEQILSAIGDAFDRRAALRRQLEETIPGVKQAVLDLFKDIADATGKPQDSPVAG
jgi:polysaccharide pyruvyl transferase WcaK-like protein